jgi:hypothetical protein
MNWTEHVDDYCERTDAGLWSEPLNFATNGLFLVAAALAYLKYRRHGRRDRGIEVQIALLAAVAIGSGLFHSLATRWAMVADVAPIGILVFAYLGYFLRHVVGLAPRAVVVGLLGFTGLSAAGALIPKAWFNNSQGYFGTLVTMIAMAAITWRSLGKQIAVAAALFAVSLTFRSIDLAVCADLPIGTHFLWHGMNAVLIYILIAAIIDRAIG